jgi:hypothetical protein
MEDGRYRPAMLAAIWKRPPGYVPRQIPRTPHRGPPVGLGWHDGDREARKLMTASYPCEDGSGRCHGTHADSAASGGWWQRRRGIKMVAPKQ